jgi:hypothetical protein
MDDSHFDSIFVWMIATLVKNKNNSCSLVLKFLQINYLNSNPLFFNKFFWERRFWMKEEEEEEENN